MRSIEELREILGDITAILGQMSTCKEEFESTRHLYDALTHLEKLEKETYDSRKLNEKLIQENEELKKENEELKEKLRKVLNSIIHYEYTRERCKREQLEKENQELRGVNFDLSISNVSLRNEIFYLKENYLNVLETIKSKCLTNSNLWLVANTDNYASYKCFLNNKEHEIIRIEHNELSQQEYEFLKDILGA